MANMTEKLFSEFQAPTTEEWLAKIEVDLKGADFQKRLVWRTNEGFNVQPFYRREDLKELKGVDSLPGEFPFIRGNKKDNNLWYVRQDLDVEDPASANEKALDLLNKGVNSLGFSIPGSKLSKEFIERLLDNILPQYVELNFSTCQRHCVELAVLLTDYFKSKNYPLAELEGSINFDPISKILEKGKDVSPVISEGKRLIEALSDLPRYKCISINSKTLNNSGESSGLWFYRDRDAKEIDLVIERDATLTPIEVRRGARPGRSASSAFGLLDRSGLERGGGAVVCMKERVGHASRDCLYVPAWVL